MTRVVVVADDLTGASDTGTGFARAGFGVAVRLGGPDAFGRSAAEAPRTEVVAVDTRSRGLDERAAAAAAARAVSGAQSVGVECCYLKVDSTLRGHLGAVSVAALRAWTRVDGRALGVVAPAFPSVGRTTVDGRQYVRGRPLPLPSVPTMLAAAGCRVARLDLASVRTERLEPVLADFHDAGFDVVVCDAETDDDLAGVAAAGQVLGRDTLWVGSGGLAAQLARLSTPRARRVAPSVVVDGAVLVVVGTTSELTRRQVEVATAEGAVPVRWAPTDDGADALAEVAAHLRSGRDVVVTLQADGRRDGEGDPRLVAGLGRGLAPHLPYAGGLVLTGGETASAVLDGVGVDTLELADEVEAGVPVAVTVPRGLPVVTKAGDFGTATTLAEVLRWLRVPPSVPEGAVR